MTHKKDITGIWNIDNAMGLSTIGAENSPYIQFEKNGKMNGNASVNTFNGTYKLSGAELTFGNIGMTRMMGASMEIEDAITQALNSTATILADKFNAVILNTRKDTIMRLSKVEQNNLSGGFGADHNPTADELGLFNRTYKTEPSLTPIRVSSQVVAGMNYKFICKDKDGQNYLVRIFKPLPGERDYEAKVTSVTKQ